MGIVRWSVWSGALMALVGCGTPAQEGTPDAGAASQDLCATPAVIACEDAVIQTLNLQKAAAPGLVTNAADGSGWLSGVDATAGGFNANPPHSYVYAKFTDHGLDKVALGDEDALASMDWDIAFRRYVIRINSADSGPSCVSAAHLPPGGGYDAVTSAGDDLAWRTDDDFTDACTLIDDGSGLPSSPGTALSGFYTYKNCVAMSGNVYAVRLKNGKKLKLTVTQYYGTGQEACNAGTGMGSGGGSVKLRWAFLP